MTPTQQKIIAHLGNGPLTFNEVLEIIPENDVARMLMLLRQEGTVVKQNGKYALRKEVANV